MMEAEAAGKSMMEAEAVRQPAEAEIMLLPAAEAEIIDLVPLLKARIFPRARSLVPYKNIILYLELPSNSLNHQHSHCVVENQPQCAVKAHHSLLKGSASMPNGTNKLRNSV